MKKTIRYILLFAALSMGVSGKGYAQNLNSAYFMDGYTYGHELNPAKDYDRKAYFSLPFLPGNLYAGVHGNLNLTDILYRNPNGPGLVTYLHPDISSSRAMSGFSRNNKIVSDIRYDIFSVGFHSRHAYNTITMSIRSNMGVNLPYDLFDLTKNLSNKDYELGRVGATATGWAELGYGYSRNLIGNIRVGGKFKILLGGGRFDFSGNNLSLRLADENQWVATANATMEANVKGMTWGEPKITTDNQGNTHEEIDFDNFDIGKAGLGGVGVAVDLGAEWDASRWVKGLKVSASLLDLGFIHWNTALKARNSGKDFVFRGFQNVQVLDGPGEDIGDQSDRLVDDIEDLYRLQDASDGKGANHALGATMNIGAEYALPMYDKLSFGFLSTTRIQGEYSWNEERISATISPCKAFELSGSVGVGTLGTSVGWAMNIHPRGFNVFMGMDHVVGKLSKQGVPLKSNADFVVGVNFPIGKTREKDSDKK